MPTVEALTSFDHGGSRRRNTQFQVSDHTARELARAGLVRIVGVHPKTVAAESTSASPAAQASPQTTAKESRRGGKRRYREEQSGE